MNKKIRAALLSTPVGRIVLMPYRLWIALSYSAPVLRNTLSWLFASRELSNFTYHLSPNNVRYLAHMISTVTKCPVPRVQTYFEELQSNEELINRVRSRLLANGLRHSCDSSVMFGRRLGWYAFVRILKPRIVVETGVDKGLGAVVLCAALLRNQAEGVPGQYFGTDINPRAGILFGEPYDRVGQILYGDSLLSLETIPSVDLFINDSDHSADYERREYEAILSKLSPEAVILGDNSHATDVLARFSEANSRAFLFFKEQPARHWYPGAGIGISF